MANPEAAAIGKVCRNTLQSLQLWDSLQPHIKVFKPTVNDIASDIKLGTVDAGFLWDSTVTQYPELEAIHLTEFDSTISTVSIAVLSFCNQPTAALRFARFLTARDQGLPRFTQSGFTVVRGDVWADSPEVVLFSGGVNRTAIEPTIRAFETREGVKVSRVYNGCGILTAQIRSGQRPDAYFACDVSFMRNVSEHFNPAMDLSETPIVILVRRGNPKGLRDLSSLATPGLAIGVANEQQSALGAMTAKMLREQGLLERVMTNVRVQTPTADLLVNQIRTGSLDAVVVFNANTVGVRESLDVVSLSGPGVLAVQPFAVGRNSDQAHLMDRLLAALRTDGSRRQFEQSGFQWRDAGARP
jgi:ABC-type molybdate transport system substrate-binding protein